jgi:RimJ/RimL family protein N-acetyltransferase
MQQPDRSIDQPARLAPVTLEGGLVRLEPLSLDHLDGLASVGLDRAIWTWMFAPITTHQEMRAWLEAALVNAESGTEVPFATIDRASGRAIGSTRYMSLAPEHRRVEIGWTWLAPAWQGSGANTEVKLLLLEHAFERLGCGRVEFKTDSLNGRSRAALLAIGATFEGIFRNHMIMADGRRRDSAYYSIIDSEWPAVRERLAARMLRRASSMPSMRSLPSVPSMRSVPSVPSVPSSTASDRAEDRRTQHTEGAS